MTLQDYIEAIVGEFVHEPLIKGDTPETWLRKRLYNLHSHIIQKDIERLEWMKTKLISKLGTHTTFELEDKIEILQTLIDIKRKELEELNEKV